MAGKSLQLLELCMAVLSSCIHILFSEILDDITLNFHSLGLIQYSLRPISNRKLPRDHNLPTLLNTVCVVSPFINELIRKENDHCFRSSNCTVQPARQPRTTAATAHGSHGPRQPRHFSGAQFDRNFCIWCPNNFPIISLSILVRFT
jgi:hypothetical protein